MKTTKKATSKNCVKNEDSAAYNAFDAQIMPHRKINADIVSEAIAHIESEWSKPDSQLTDTRESGKYLKLRLHGLPYEVFSVLLLDNKHRVVGYSELFKGTIDGCSVFPREVIREVMHHNAAAVIFAHNHPSGISEPSSADRAITLRLRDALALIDVRTLDHFVIGEGEPTSLAARGWI